MGILNQLRRNEPPAPQNGDNVRRGDQSPSSTEIEKGRGLDTQTPVKLFTPRIFAMIMIVSLGGLIFGYDTGQISGFLEMDDFLSRFGNTTDADGNPAFTKVRSGTIVGLLSIGTLIGAIVGAPIADAFGRKLAIVFWNIIFCVGVVVQMTTLTTWYQIAIGRWVAGLGVGALSVLTPMYQSETAPRQIRGSMVSCYQLFITLGIFIAYCINYGTKDEYVNQPASWRIPMGVGYIWSVIMGVGIMFLRESPRWEYRKGRVESARTTIAKSYGVPENHWEVDREVREIQAKLDAENAGGGKHPWYEVFTGPRMMYRTLLGISMQALQQLTGANFFFYYGTTVFSAVGLNDSFQTSMILGGVNFVMTIPGTYVVEKFGRRRALITGGLWMFMCFLVFASVGSFQLDQNTPTNTPQAGNIMIAFACLFIAGYAMTWAPIVWAIVGELYPTRYRAQAMGLATASNWIWNFLISFFTPFITGAINYRYGYVFAACNFLGVVVVYFFLCETRGRSLEEIDTMYIMHVPPRKSTNWVPPQGEDLVTADSLHLAPGARNIRKADAAGMEGEQRLDSIPAPTEQHGIHDVSGTGYEAQSGGVRGHSVY